MLFGITDRLLLRLEMVQRSAARVVMQIRRGDRQSKTTIPRQLHWLPIKRRIEYNIVVLVHKALYGGTPEYLAALLHQYAPRRCLSSAGGLLLDVPRVNSQAWVALSKMVSVSKPLRYEQMLSRNRRYGIIVSAWIFGAAVAASRLSLSPT